MSIEVERWSKVSSRRFRVRRIAAVSMLLSIMMGCSTNFKLPPVTENSERLYLLSYSSWGHHSLAFVRGDELVEFTYGDWDLFALLRRDPWTAWKNMTFRTQGALGRKTVRWAGNTPLCSLFTDCVQAVSFQAPVHKSEALFSRLESAYDEQRHTEVLNKVDDVYFVKYSVPYWGFHNCNHELADWLEELGGEVGGRVFINPDFIGGMQHR